MDNIDIKCYGNQHGHYVSFNDYTASMLAEMYQLPAKEACEKFINQELPKLLEEMRKNA